MDLSVNSDTLCTALSFRLCQVCRAWLGIEHQDATQRVQKLESFVPQVNSLGRRVLANQLAACKMPCTRFGLRVLMRRLKADSAVAFHSILPSWKEHAKIFEFLDHDKNGSVLRACLSQLSCMRYI